MAWNTLQVQLFIVTCTHLGMVVARKLPHIHSPEGSVQTLVLTTWIRVGKLNANLKQSKAYMTKPHSVLTSHISSSLCVSWQTELIWQKQSQHTYCLRLIQTRTVTYHGPAKLSEIIGAVPRKLLGQGSKQGEGYCQIRIGIWPVHTWLTEIMACNTIHQVNYSRFKRPPFFPQVWTTIQNYSSR